MKRNIFSIFATIVIINLPPVKWMTGEDIYSNVNGTFTFGEVNYASRNFKLCLDNFLAFKSINKKGTILYRITQKKFIKFGYGAILFLMKNMNFHIELIEI